MNSQKTPAARRRPVDARRHHLEVTFRAIDLMRNMTALRGQIDGLWTVRRGLPWVGLGLNPRKSHPLSHDVVSADLIPMTAALMGDEDFRKEGIFVVANPGRGINVLHQLGFQSVPDLCVDTRSWVEGMLPHHQTSPSEVESLAEMLDFRLKKQSQMDAFVGHEMRMMIESVLRENLIQSHSFDLDETSAMSQVTRVYRPVVLMSDIMDNPALFAPEHEGSTVKELFASLNEIIKKEASEGGRKGTLVRAIWQSIPACIRKQHFTDFGGKTYRKLTLTQREVACGIMGYVLMQIAIVLHMGGVKYGHVEGEKPFDELVKVAIEKYPDQLGLDEVSRNIKFKYFNLSSKNNVPYRWHNLDSKQGQIPPRPPFDTIGFYGSSADGDLEDRVATRVEKYLPIIEKMLWNMRDACQFLPSEYVPSGPIFVGMKIMKLLRGLAAELNSDPDLKKALDDSGVNGVLFGLTPIADLMQAQIDTARIPDVVGNRLMIYNYTRMISALHALDSESVTVDSIVQALSFRPLTSFFDRLKVQVPAGALDFNLLINGDGNTIQHYGFPTVDAETLREFSRFSGSPKVTLKYLLRSLTRQLEARKMLPDHPLAHKEIWFIDHMAEVISGVIPAGSGLMRPLNEIFDSFKAVFLNKNSLDVPFD